MAFPQAPEPKSGLGYYRQLAPAASVKVSPLVLGGANFGDAWAGLTGETTKEAVFQYLDTFYELGGNIIDTANNYQNGQSEEWLGEWMQSRKNRDEVVLTTKFSTTDPSDAKIKANAFGNNAKSLHIALKGSLERLKTDYVDILSSLDVHWWEYGTSIEELMQALNALVKSGKVLYLGVSNTPAYIIARANEYARGHALAQFSVYSGNWSVISREIEREILPMAREYGMAIVAYGVTGMGKFQTKKTLEKRGQTGDQLRNFLGAGQSLLEKKASTVLEKIADELGTESITAVAIAYILAKAPYVFPIIGGRKIDQLHENIQALSLVLKPEHVEQLDKVSIDEETGLQLAAPIDGLFGTNPKYNGGIPNAVVSSAGRFRYVEGEKAIQPVPKQ